MMHAASTWSTSSFGHAADPLPTELDALGEHLHQCRRLSGRLFTLQCGGEAVHRFMAARLVTTVVVLALLIGGAVLAW
jgi:hypothetical protein